MNMVYLVRSIVFLLQCLSTLSCDFFQNLIPGKVYDIFSPNYSRRYVPNFTCRWVAVAPEDHNIDLSCIDVDLPQSPKCVADRLELSETGRLDLKDSQRICGRGAFNHQTPNNILVLSLVSPSKTKGGKLYCSARAVENKCSCGRKDRTRIVGGVATKVNEFPWMAGLVDVSGSDKVYCGATLISEKYFLTAGHCLEGRRMKDLVVLVGDDNTTTGYDTPYANIYRIARVLMHPLYKGNGAEHDIAIVNTFDDVEFNDGVSPICLPFRYHNELVTFKGESVTAIGWGTLEFSGPKSDKLMKVNLDVINDRECLERGMKITVGHMCTYTRGKDTCQFDSGGPLMYHDKRADRYHLVGIISYGVACASKYPSVNVRVTSYLDWITENTVEVHYCVK